MALPASSETQIQSSEKFFHYFQQETHNLQIEIEKLQSSGSSIGERQAAVDNCLSSIARLSNEVNDVSAVVPPRDQKTYADAIKVLNAKLQEARVTFAPRPKFAFKSGLAFTAKKNASVIGVSNGPRSEVSGAPIADGIASEVPPLPSVNSSLEGAKTSSSLHIADLRDSRMAPDTSSLQTAGSGTILNITQSVVDLSKLDAEGKPLAGLILKHVNRSLIICGRVEGAAHFTGIRDSVIVVLSRQFRMHDSTGCQVYLLTSSRPIIEDCSGISFAPAPVCFRNATDESKGDMWSNVDDFKWLKSEPSPNWHLLEPGKRVPSYTWKAISTTWSDSDVSDILQAVGIKL